MPASGSRSSSIGAPPASEAPLEQLVRALHDPRCYPHPVDRVQVIETHISVVLLAGAFAYKLKKPLDLGFLDFTTLELRRQCCEDELRLNRRSAPQIYLGVVAITGTLDAPRIGGEAPVIEYAVLMGAFEQDDLLDRRLSEGKAGADEIDEIAQVVADFHQRIDRAGAGSEFGSPASVWKPVRENFQTLRRLVDGAEERHMLAVLARWSRGRHRQLAPWFLRRQAEGFVRECHGDLHLGNIARISSAICLFDCLEFNPSLRWIDVANEIAFTVMDLADRGRADLGWRLLDTWLMHTGDHDALPGLSCYLVYRALVRAKVSALRAAQPDVDREQRRRLDQQRHTYLTLASTCAAARPMIAITHGVSGSGKSYGSMQLLMRIGAVRVRSDVERKRLFGLAPGERSRSGLGEAIYDQQATARTYAKLETAVRAAIAGGLPVIVDATFLQRAARDRFRALAESLNVPFVILAFSAPERELRVRVVARERSGDDPSDSGLEVLQHQLAQSHWLDEDEYALAIVIDARGSAAAASLDRAVAALSERLHSTLALQAATEPG